ncbi:metal ABC transporter substrate-binding protein [Pasteurella skyensis]|uniref:Metal ABC transporter substrate-binding protein n=1 Tax=Phocoenobacter skyensis TaxID=97481 RepID=A0AAJ6P0A0_9PAST|nr:metal ABC transporter substrate-binding protein [Pasteurella skyensis]MDP8162489.1 metal ABC transporter substrate-binding protein [Pasteurella skyensis]MDP8172454.1 metal ABC transporter substrate-binding protein [Pasteurella skyensis]MDP8177479.1 metal ABC transporter substrate-binding protein [Pasteurella skyensis]MDP8178709.1 metal ABC transporter substrate-binding protein [Pasteurella skyensis]MDP8183001.1 metal ABC transporter substrate-binding protein [Pasteurella skyensis]
MKNKLLLTSLLIGSLFSPLSYAKFKVVTTFTVIQDMAQNVAGDSATVVSITKPNADIHGYQPTSKDIVKAQDANLILWNGLYLEKWFEKFLHDIGDLPNVVITDGIEPMDIYEGEYKGRPNPHTWMSPKNAEVYIENIKNAFVKYDPDNAKNYEKNAKAYLEKIRQLDAPLRAKLSQVPESQRWLATSEGAFSYLARDYGYKEAYIWPINSEQQGSPDQVKNLIDKVRKHNIPVVFSESTISPKPAKQVAKESGAKYGGVLYVDSLSNPNGPVPTYIDLLKTTVTTIVEGFEK